MPTYTFDCPCGWQGDQRTTFDANNVRCPSCDATAQKRSVYAVGVSGFARTPADRRDYSRDFKNFTEASAELEYKHGRMEEGVGKRLPPPPLYQASKAKAKNLISKGATSADDLS